MSDFRADLRLQFKRTVGAVNVEFDPTFTWTGGDAVQIQNLDTFPLNQLPGTDSHRYFDWSDEVFSREKQRIIARIDRLSLMYRQPTWSLQVGRQAVSWGNGLVFQPLDLFAPFSPTAIDREFKPGVDSMLFESLVGEAGELQVLWVGRQGELPERSTHTIALKWQAQLREFAIELTLAEHISDDFAAVSLSLPLAGSLLRVEASRLCHIETCFHSGLVNMDYTISLGSTLLYVFGEFYHNGFGLNQADTFVPQTLQERILRGEVFTLMKNYVSLGMNITWHPLWSQSFILLNNLADHSGLFQTTVNYEPGDASRMQFGFAAPFGDDNTEFGIRRLNDTSTSGGGSTWFVSLSYYF